MKSKVLLVLTALGLLLTPVARAAEESTAKAELQDLIKQVQTKLTSGKRSEADLEPELKQFDALLEKHKGEKTDEVAEILRMKSMLYLQVLDNGPKAISAIEQIKKDYPDTKAAKSADDTIAFIKKQEEGKKVQKTLVAGAKFPDFQEKDTNGKSMSVSAYKGKVLLVDFWATWCGPCIGELPNVLKAYEAYHGKGFEIIGISLDSDTKKLADFTEEKKMPWQQYCDGKRWESKLAAKYGVNSIPATYLLNREGVIIAKNLRGEELDKAVAKALEAK